jgi:hypothetical protein
MADEQRHLHIHTHYSRRPWVGLLVEAFGWMCIGGAIVITYAIVAYK